MAQWLHLSRNTDGWILGVDSRFRKILIDMEDPLCQFPSLICFIGGQSKSQALRALFPFNNTRRSCAPCFAKLHISTNTANTPHPILIVDGASDESKEKELGGSSMRYENQRTSFEIRRKNYQSFDEIRNTIYSHLILPFAHVVYLFPDDIGGLGKIQEILLSWLGELKDGRPRLGLTPQVVLVLTNPEVEYPASEVLYDTLSTSLGSSIASSLAIVDLRSRHALSREAKFEPLRSQLSHDIQKARRSREDEHILFSATHLEALFSKATEHMAYQGEISFNAIQAAKDHCKVPLNASIYLQEFIASAIDAGESIPAIAMYISSALIMDAYPPGMHRFDPLLMFQTHYAKICLAAWKEISAADAEHGLCAIEVHFCLMFRKLTNESKTAMVRRCSVARRQFGWKYLKSNTTCLSCLLRGTDEILPCGHAICENCVRIWGKRAGEAEYHFELSFCILCPKRFKHIVRCLPPTKGPDLLVLDGGGVRGVRILAFMCKLEKIRQWRPLRNDVHFSMGTSVGGLILLETFVQGSSASEALEKFKPLAREIFPSKARHKGPMSLLWNLMRHVLADAAYDSSSLDTALQRAFGSTRRFYDTPLPTPGGRIALTASHIENDGKLSLFSNYRRLRRPNEQTSYTSVMPTKLADEPLVWKVARCCIAALGYFKPEYLPGIGTFQDGGIQANCPLRTAIRESMNIWPGARRPDLVISIGTGFEKSSPERGQEQRQTIFNNNFVGRGIRTFLSSPAVDGYRGFEDALDNLPPDLKEDVFRLDCAFDGTLPDLDDTERMEELSDMECHIPPELSLALLATSFFFEFDQEPVFSNGRFNCIGSIMCCKPNPNGVLSLLRTEFPRSRFVIRKSEDIGPVDKHDGCHICGYYRKRVSFTVSSLHEDFKLAIVSQEASRKIGGFPTSVAALLVAQQAYAPFGRSDHHTDIWPLNRRCYCCISLNKRGGDDLLHQEPCKRKKLKQGRV